MSRRRLLIISVLGGLALLVILLNAMMVVSRPQRCCGPEIPIYPGATAVQSDVEPLFSGGHEFIRRVRYFTAAPAEELRAYYRKAYESRGYSYSYCCNQSSGELYMPAGESRSGDLHVRWTEVEGGRLVDASISALSAGSCDCK